MRYIVTCAARAYQVEANPGEASLYFLLSYSTGALAQGLVEQKRVE